MLHYSSILAIELTFMEMYRWWSEVSGRGGAAFDMLLAWIEVVHLFRYLLFSKRFHSVYGGVYLAWLGYIYFLGLWWLILDTWVLVVSELLFIFDFMIIMLGYFWNLIIWFAKLIHKIANLVKWTNELFYKIVLKIFETIFS